MRKGKKDIVFAYSTSICHRKKNESEMASSAINDRTVLVLVLELHSYVSTICPVLAYFTTRFLVF